MMDGGVQRVTKGKGGGGRRDRTRDTGERRAAGPAWAAVCRLSRLPWWCLSPSAGVLARPLRPLSHLSCERVGVKEGQREQAEADGQMD